MQVCGVDFTSAPTRRKPITRVDCDLRDGRLQAQSCAYLPSFEAFETSLQQPGPWLAAFDFPFGLPRRLLTALAWPLEWDATMLFLAEMGQAAFEAELNAYRVRQPPGDKLHRRMTDRLAGAISPMMLQRVPVGKMFYQGAPRLLAAGVSVLPCHPTAADRQAIEGYPALVARRWLGRRRPYKSDDRRLDPALLPARAELLAALARPEAAGYYGFEIRLADELAEQCLLDTRGDSLDALLCAIQAGWAASQGAPDYGIPLESDRTEGWIVDPSLVY